MVCCRLPFRHRLSVLPGHGCCSAALPVLNQGLAVGAPTPNQSSRWNSTGALRALWGFCFAQFEWFEAARRAGLTSKVMLCQGLLQTDAGDVVMDCITHSAAQLPTLPGE